MAQRSSKTPSLSSIWESTMGTRMLGLQENRSRPGKNWRTGKRVGSSKPTRCLFLADDGSLKWIAVNAGVFRDMWWWRSTKNLEFPPFPTGDWNVGQIRRLENGEVKLTKTLKLPLEGISNGWHPTKTDFTEFQLVKPLKDWPEGGMRFHVKHPLFGEKVVLMKLQPYASNWSIRAMSNETKAYQMIQGLHLAPEFLGHVTYQGAIIGFILERVEGAKITEKEDEDARLEAIKKLHDLGITHGSAHHESFLKVGESVLMKDFGESRFGSEASEVYKSRDIERIRRFDNDFWGGPLPRGEKDDFIPENNKFFDPLSDDEINWTDDSYSSGSDESDSESYYSSDDSDN
ncbi:hypothetical protein F4777DRAFT_544243 [Nemania sp. FL0916]|nr:hypothetical protein F4777DRAFT_544243 [Nemania sp. FL0916]